MSKSIIRVIDASRGFEEFPMRDQVSPRRTVGWSPELVPMSPTSAYQVVLIKQCSRDSTCHTVLFGDSLCSAY